jgi:hypothetical protein
MYLFVNVSMKISTFLFKHSLIQMNIQAKIEYRTKYKIKKVTWLMKNIERIRAIIFPLNLSLLVN